MKIEDYRQRLEQFYESLNRDLLSTYSGIGKPVGTTALYSDYSDLFSLEAICEMESEMKQTPDSFASRRRSLDRLHRCAMEHNLDSSTSQIDQEIRALERQRRVEWDGRRTSISEVPSLLSREVDAEKRRSLNSIYTSGLRELESLRRERLALLRDAAARLGFTNPLNAGQNISGVPYDDLSKQLDGLLSETESLYLDQMNTSLLSTLGLSVHETRQFDLGYWRRMGESWKSYQPDRMLPAVEETIARLGLQPSDSGRISVDLERRPEKHPRPACIPVRVPHEIKILLTPMGEFGDCAALLHESGHALHFAWTSLDLPAECRLWGDRGLSEIYGFLFESLRLDEEWLREAFGAAPPSDLLRFQSLFQAYLFRHSAGLLRFLIQLQGKAVSEAAGTYAECMRLCTGLEHEPEGWLEDSTDGFYAADYLRAWIFTTMLRDYLRRKYGNAWYRSGRAGNFLKEIWETGQLYSADELCRELGLGVLDVQAFLDESREGLRR
jgi:hypothetical protein